MIPSQDEIRVWQDALGGAPAQDILAFALERFPGKVTIASSFGAEDMVIIDMAARLTDRANVFCLDTGLLFGETYALMDLAESRYSIQLRRQRPALTLGQQAEAQGPQLWTRDPDKCCALRKIAPLREALTGYGAWITGIRREQSAARQNAQPVEWDAKFELVKFNPLVAWSQDEVWAYLTKHDVPYNPLHDQGYPSIGCSPCTRPVRPGESSRAGRWAGFSKTECGLHL